MIIESAGKSGSHCVTVIPHHNNNYGECILEQKLVLVCGGGRLESQCIRVYVFTVSTVSLLCNSFLYVYECQSMPVKESFVTCTAI